MAESGTNELKHLLHPESGEWIGEYDPIFGMDSVRGEATSVAATLCTVATGKTLFAYGLIVSNLSTTYATIGSYAILEGATIKLMNPIIGGDIHDFSRHPRAPILKFASHEPVAIRSGGAPTISVTMSFWEAEVET